MTPELAAAAERMRADWRSYWPLFHASRDEAAACPACNPPAPELEAP